MSNYVKDMMLALILLALFTTGLYQLYQDRNQENGVINESTTINNDR